MSFRGAFAYVEAQLVDDTVQPLVRLGYGESARHCASGCIWPAAVATKTSFCLLDCRSAVQRRHRTALVVSTSTTPSDRWRYPHRTSETGRYDPRPLCGRYSAAECSPNRKVKPEFVLDELLRRSPTVGDTIELSPSGSLIGKRRTQTIATFPV